MAAQQAILDALLGPSGLLASSKAEARCAGVVWMVSLLTFCGGQGGQAQELGKEVQGQGQGQAEGHMKAGEAEGQAQARSRLCALLPQFQAALSGLLGDVNELTQVGGGEGGSCCLLHASWDGVWGCTVGTQALEKTCLGGPCLGECQAVGFRADFCTQVYIASVKGMHVGLCHWLLG